LEKKNELLHFKTNYEKYCKKQKKLNEKNVSKVLKYLKIYVNFNKKISLFNKN